MNEELTQNVQNTQNQNAQNWYTVRDREAEGLTMPEGEDNNFAYEYNNEESIKQYIPDYKNYKWYQQPTTGNFYSLGEQLENAININNSESVENIIESNPQDAMQTLQEVVDVDNGISQSDVAPLAEEINQLSDNDPNNDEISNEVVEDTIKEINSDTDFENWLEEQEKAEAQKNENNVIDENFINEQKAMLEQEANERELAKAMVGGAENKADLDKVADFSALVEEIVSNDLPMDWKDSKVDDIYKYYHKKIDKLGEGDQRRDLYSKMVRSVMNEIKKNPERYADGLDEYEGSIGLAGYLGKSLDYQNLESKSPWHTRQNLVDSNELFNFSQNIFDAEKLKREGFTTNQAFEISSDPLAYMATNNRGSEKLRAIWDEEATKAGMPSYSDLVKEFANQKDDTATFRNFAKGQISRDELINGLKEKGNHKAALVATKLSDKDLQNDNLVKYVMNSFRSRKSEEQNEKLIDDAVKEYKKGRAKELFDELGIDEKTYKDFVKEQNRIGFELGDSYTKDFEMVDNPNNLPAVSSGNQLANIDERSLDVINVEYTIEDDIADIADKKDVQKELEEIKKEKDTKEKMKKLWKLSDIGVSVPSIGSFLNKKQSISPETKSTKPTSKSSSNGVSVSSGGSGSIRIGDTIVKNIKPINAGLGKKSGQYQSQSPIVATNKVNDFASKSSNIQKEREEVGGAIKQSQSKKDIKAGKTSLPSGESSKSSGSSGKLSIKDDLNVSSIKEKIIYMSKSWEIYEDGTRTSQNKYLPFKFFVKDDFVGVSQVGSGIKRQSLESFIKKNPNAVRILQKIFF